MYGCDFLISFFFLFMAFCAVNCTEIPLQMVWGCPGRPPRWSKAAISIIAKANQRTPATTHNESSSSAPTSGSSWVLWSRDFQDPSKLTERTTSQHLKWVLPELKQGVAEACSLFGDDLQARAGRLTRSAGRCSWPQQTVQAELLLSALAALDLDVISVATLRIFRQIYSVSIIGLLTVLRWTCLAIYYM